MFLICSGNHYNTYTLVFQGLKIVIVIFFSYLTSGDFIFKKILILRNLYADREGTELDMEQQTGSKSGKEYIKAVYCHPAYLTYMQSTS